MTTVMINDSSREGRRLMGLIRRSAEKSPEGVVHIDQEDFELVAEPFEKIPGLPYTYEERLASIRRSEADYAAGNYFTHQEVMEKMRAKYPNP